MKAIVYIEKRDFDGFFTWLNRLKQGTLEPSPVSYSLSTDEIERPLQVLLNPDEFAIIQDAERNIEDIKKSYGNLSILYRPESLVQDKIMMGDVLRNAIRHDCLVEIYNTSIELAMAIPGLTPLDALIIAEREWIPIPTTSSIEN